MKGIRVDDWLARDLERMCDTTPPWRPRREDETRPRTAIGWELRDDGDGTPRKIVGHILDTPEKREWWFEKDGGVASGIFVGSVDEDS